MKTLKRFTPALLLVSLLVLGWHRTAVADVSIGLVNSLIESMLKRKGITDSSGTYAPASFTGGTLTGYVNWTTGLSLNGGSQATAHVRGPTDTALCIAAQGANNLVMYAGNDGTLVAGGQNITATSGTKEVLILGNGSYGDGGTNSTTVQRIVSAQPTINFTGGTRTGNYDVFHANVTETSAPTGHNTLFRGQVGGANKFAVSSAGLTSALKGVFSSTFATSSNAVLNCNDGSYAGISAIFYSGTDNATPDRFQSSSSAGPDFDKILVLYRTRGSMASPTAVNDGDYLGRITAQAMTSGGFTTQPAALLFKAHGTVGSGNLGGKLVILTNPDGSGTQSERWEVDNTGALRALNNSPFIATTYATAVKATQSATVTLDATATVWPFDTSGGNRDADLPAAATCPGRVYVIKKISSDGNTLTIDPDGAETIDGAGSVSTTTQYASFTIISTGTAWLIQ